jgi:hypothetical protein
LRFISHNGKPFCVTPLPKREGLFVFTKFLVLSVLFSFSVAHAQEGSSAGGVPEGPAAGTSEASHANLSGIIDNLYINYFGIFHGPELTNLGSAYTPNNKGIEPKAAYSDGTNVMNFDSELTVAYMLTKDMGIGPDLQFSLYTARGYGATMGDSGVKLFDKAFVKTHNLRVYANIIVEAPTNEYDKTRGVDVKFKMTPYVRYDFSGSRFSIGSWTEETWYAGASDSIANNKLVKLYVEPYILYQLAPKWALNLSYDYEVDRMAGKTGFDFTTYQTDVMPGFVYVLTPKIIVNPYLQFFTTDKIAIDRTAIGAVVSASL